MLNIFTLLKNKINNKNSVNMENSKTFYKEFPASVREWNNSIYTFNKNSLSLIPQTRILAIKIIKSYFNLYNIYLERRLRRTRLLRRLRMLSSHKIYVSNGEYKHTNNKVTITLYTFNRQKRNFFNKIKNRYLDMLYRNNVIKNRLNKKFYIIKNKGLNYLEKANTNKKIIIKALNVIQRLNNKKTFNNYKLLYSSSYLTKFYKKVVKKSLRKLKIYLLYKQILYTNKTKFNYSYLQVLNTILQKIYNKNVEFNLVNLKYNYLNSDIFSESILLKTRKNRRKLLRFLKVLIKKVKVHKISKYVTHEPNLNNTLSIYTKDIIEQVIENKKVNENKNLRKVVLDNIKHKHLTGVRLEISGRLNKRFTASRSQSKLKYKGNLIDVDSSYKGLSTVLLKGNLKSNMQFTKLNSKTRVGSFGIKGWVSGN